MRFEFAADCDLGGWWKAWLAGVQRVQLDDGSCRSFSYSKRPNLFFFFLTVVKQEVIHSSLGTIALLASGSWVYTLEQLGAYTELSCASNQLNVKSNKS